MENKISNIKQFLKDKKNRIALMKSSLAVVTTLLVTGCGNTKQTELQKNKPQTSTEQIDHDTVIEGTTIEQIIQETLENTTNKEEQNNTTINKEEPTTQNNTTISKEEQTTENKVSTEEYTNKYTTTTAKTTTASNSTNKQPTTTTKITNKQTTTTTKPTPTQSTTTKEQTKPPVQQTSGYKIEDIATNGDAFCYYAGWLNRDLMQGNGIRPGYQDVTFGGKECEVALVMLNYDSISDNVIKEIFANYTKEEIRNGTLFYCMIADIQKSLNTDVDFSKYTIDKEIGNYLNKIDNANRIGQIDSFLYDACVNVNISDKCLNNIAVVGLLTSYDTKHLYSNIDLTSEYYLDPFVKHISEVALGKSYTK